MCVVGLGLWCVPLHSFSCIPCVKLYFMLLFGLFGASFVWAVLYPLHCMFYCRVPGLHCLYDPLCTFVIYLSMVLIGL